MAAPHRASGAGVGVAGARWGTRLSHPGSGPGPGPARERTGPPRGPGQPGKRRALRGESRRGQGTDPATPGRGADPAEHPLAPRAGPERALPGGGRAPAASAAPSAAPGPASRAGTDACVGVGGGALGNRSESGQRKARWKPAAGWAKPPPVHGPGAAPPRCGARTPRGGISGVLGASRGGDPPACSRLRAPPSGRGQRGGEAMPRGRGEPALTPSSDGGVGGPLTLGCGSRRDGHPTGGIPADTPGPRRGKNVAAVPHHGGIPSPWRPGANRPAIVCGRGPLPGLSPRRGEGRGPGDPGAAALPHVGAGGGAGRVCTPCGVGGDVPGDRG